MQIEVTENHFSSEDEALAEIADRGWHGIVLDVDVDDEELHFHDFNAVVYVVSGVARAAYADGSIIEAHPGSRVEAPGWVLHQEVDSHHRSVFGIDVPLEKLTVPINKPASDLVV